jgi:tRNA A-37 threonylcarbamoyl transferase component Bud32
VVLLGWKLKKKPNTVMSFAPTHPRDGDEIVWRECAPGEARPPLGPDLGGWEIQKVRRSHWNARRSAAGKTYFLKWFFHGPLRSPARAEWENALRLDRLGIPTVLPVGWGTHRRGSFLVLEGSPGLPADEWRRRSLPGEMERLTVELAGLVSRLHDARLCHRDLNVYHVLVDGGRLRMIDVGRVAPFWRRRWIVKDLASLLCSAEAEGFPPRLARLFFRSYLKSTQRAWERRLLLRAVLSKRRGYRRHNEKHARP